MEEFFILSQLSTLLKNAEQCPSLLRTIKITNKLSSPKIEELVDSIEQSLSIIHEKMTNPTPISNSCPVTT